MLVSVGLSFDDATGLDLVRGFWSRYLWAFTYPKKSRTTSSMNPQNQLLLNAYAGTRGAGGSPAYYVSRSGGRPSPSPGSRGRVMDQLTGSHRSRSPSKRPSRRRQRLSRFDRMVLDAINSQDTDDDDEDEDGDASGPVLVDAFGFPVLSKTQQRAKDSRARTLDEIVARQRELGASPSQSRAKRRRSGKRSSRKKKRVSRRRGTARRAGKKVRSSRRRKGGRRKK